MIYRILLLALFLLTSGSAFARNITLEWDPNSEPDIAGYKIYYKADSPDLPLDGAGAAQGASPVDVGSLTQGTLSGLEEGRIYYFAVTAYNSAGYESSFSNIVASDWVPVLISPTDGSTASLSYFRFDWQSPPAEFQGTFTLCYGSDPQLNPANQEQALATPPGARPPKPPTFLLPLLAVLLTLSLPLAGRKKIAAAIPTTVLCVLLTSCGGGGGENAPMLTGGTGETGTAGPGTSAGQGDSGVGGQTGGTSAPASFTRCISGITDNYYTPGANDLTPGTSYYWKVTAVETATDAERESTHFTFDTEAQ